MVLVTMIFSSCRKDDEIGTSPAYKLSFSADTLIFDTVFATIGSTTRYLKVFNRNDKKVNISRIYLANGENSQYKINIDGIGTSSMNDLEIESGDSIFIFVKVTIDPNNQNSPFIVEDSILFETNGNTQDVDLAAWGQNAHYYVGNKMLEGLSYPYTIIAEENEIVTWEDDKPYIIYGWGVVDSAARLIIGPGVNVYFHQNSGLWIYRGGNLRVNGEKDSLVTFQGDRLETEYQDLPGQWDRIWINEGSDAHIINYAVIKNSFIGIHTEPLVNEQSNLTSALILNNTIIQSASNWGLYSYAYQIISANTVISNCAAYAACLVGGAYDFRQCTFANYWTQTVRLDPSVLRLSNTISFQLSDGSVYTLASPLAEAYFGNCILYGNLDEEIDSINDSQYDFNFKFDHCVLKTQLKMNNPEYYYNSLRNIDPKFIDYSVQNYRLDTLSPMIDAGNPDVIINSPLDITFDLDGNPRNQDIAPDLGAYEYKPEAE